MNIGFYGFLIGGITFAIDAVTFKIYLFTLLKFSRKRAVFAMNQARFQLSLFKDIVFHLVLANYLKSSIKAHLIDIGSNKCF